MTPVESLRGQRVALFGLGGSGLSTARALVAGGAEAAAWDDNPAARERAEAAGVALVDLARADWRGFKVFVLAPGVPLTHPKPHWTVNLADAAGVPIIGDIELFARERGARAPDAPFVAITGTNGKSTTTALIAHVLKEAAREVAMGGNIGVPVLDLPPPASGRTHVVECSSYQIDLAPSLNPSIGLLINITPDHLDRHGDLARYAAIKERLVANAKVALVGVDDEPCREIHARLKARAGIARVIAVSGTEFAARRRLGQPASRDGARRNQAGGRSFACARASLRPQRAECGVRLCRDAGARRRARPYRACVRDISRPCASDGRGRPAWPGAVHQRFQGDQRRRRREGAAHFPGYPLDYRRESEGGRGGAAEAALSARRQGLFDRGGERRIRSHARRRRSLRTVRNFVRGDQAAADDERNRRRANLRCCFRRRARRSISSRISRRAATPSGRASPNGSSGARKRTRARNKGDRAHGFKSGAGPCRRLDAHRRSVAARVVHRAHGDRPRDGAGGQSGGRRAAEPFHFPLRQPPGFEADPNGGPDDRHLFPLAAACASRGAGDIRGLVRAHHSRAHVRR